MWCAAVKDCVSIVPDMEGIFWDNLSFLVVLRKLLGCPTSEDTNLSLHLLSMLGDIEMFSRLTLGSKKPHSVSKGSDQTKRMQWLNCALQVFCWHSSFYVVRIQYSIKLPHESTFIVVHSTFCVWWNWEKPLSYIGDCKFACFCTFWLLEGFGVKEEINGLLTGYAGWFRPV